MNGVLRASVLGSPFGCVVPNMTDEKPGLAIALERIEREASERTGFLDLGMLGLTELPDALFRLTHIRRLNLGGGFRLVTASNIAPNDLGSALERLIELPELEGLSFAGSHFVGLAKLATLSRLWWLDCSSTQVADLTALVGFSALVVLICSFTEVDDLAPLAGLSSLQYLDCSDTHVQDLSPLAGLGSLQWLFCSGCRLIDFSSALLNSQSLVHLSLYNTFVPGIPAEVLSQSWDDNCLESLRAHFRDLEAGTIAPTDVKLVVLGNGRVGKTQICRRLRNEDYDDTIPSTHGIKVGCASLPMQDGEEPIKLHIWDFGGQDIYHGTHALFMKTNAVFMIVWTPEMENQRTHEHDGMVFRNYPLAYWVDYVRHLGGKDVPVLIIQTRCDRPEDKADCPVPEPTLRAAFGNYEVLRYSALNDRGRSALDEALQEAVRWLHDRQGIATIGAGRQRVKLRLESMRDADAAVPAEQRQYRTITQEHFRQTCAEENGTSDPRYLLAFLHNAGLVFYREGLFDDRVVLDQQWALDAIYAVFNRKKCYKLLRQQHGRFTRSLLDALVWQGYKPAEQELFLDMMQSCGICFVHKRGDERLGIEAEYIAPDLLPEKCTLETALAEKWDASANYEEAEWEFDLLHQGLIRAILSRIGGEAGVSATYWQGGLCVFENSTRSHALIEQDIRPGGWSGSINLRTQGRHAADLRDRLSSVIQQEIDRFGLASRQTRTLNMAEILEILRFEPDASDKVVRKELIPLEYADAPRSTEPRWYVSYAWRDASSQNREEIVDQLCDEAEGRDSPIIRDKATLKVGDSIARFMKQIGQGDRVFVILSDKYLKSPFCMFELFEIWRNCKRDEDDFIRRCKIYCLDDTNIWTIEERLGYAEYWETKYEKIKPKAYLLGSDDFDEFKLMDDFAKHVGKILGLFAKIVQPRTFEDLVKYGFDDPPEASN